VLSNSRFKPKASQPTNQILKNQQKTSSLLTTKLSDFTKKYTRFKSFIHISIIFGDYNTKAMAEVS